MARADVHTVTARAAYHCEDQASRFIESAHSNVRGFTTQSAGQYGLPRDQHRAVTFSRHPAAPSRTSSLSDETIVLGPTYGRVTFP